ARVEPRRNHAGVVIGTIAVALDITEYRRAEQRVRQRESELAHALRLTTMGEMAAGLAHELNQPLRAIGNYAKGCIHRLHSEQSVSPDLLDALEQIATQSLRAAEVIRRLRRFLRKQPPQREWVQLDLLVADVVRLLDSEIRERGIGVQLELAPD